MERKPLIPAVNPELLVSELTPELLLRHTNRADNEIYIFHANQAPNVMRELGRLREEAFSLYGGGTGKEMDIDEYDLDPNGYMQLIVWDPKAKEILGGYRYMCGADSLVDVHVRPHLATAEMFEFSPKFIEEYLPHTIELGRSFVSVSYQSTLKSTKGLFVLDNLWDGLGALIVKHPDVRYFFGKVTMYRDYDRSARNLILYFLSLHFFDKDGLARPRDPLSIDIDPAVVAELFPTDDYEANYRTLNRIVREKGYTIPPLINSYMSLSPDMKVLGTAINESFGYVEETAIFIDIEKIKEEKKERHIKTYIKDCARNGQA